MGAAACVTRTALRLASGARIHFDTKAGRHILTHCEGAVLLNAMAVFVLRLCDGTHSRHDILQKMGFALGSPQAHDIHAFLDTARALTWITERPRASCFAIARRGRRCATHGVSGTCQ